MKTLFFSIFIFGLFLLLVPNLFFYNNFNEYQLDLTLSVGGTMAIVGLVILIIVIFGEQEDK